MNEVENFFKKIGRELASGSGNGLLILIGSIFFIVLVAKAVGPFGSFDGANEVDERRSGNSPSETTVVVSEQPSEGVTEKDMDAEFLSRYMDWHRSTFEKKYRASLGSAYGEDARMFFDSLKSEGVYSYLPTTSGGSKKLLIVRTRSPRGEVQIAEATGIAEGNVVRVLCARKHGEVLITQGECGKAMNKRFDVRVNTIK